MTDDLASTLAEIRDDNIDSYADGSTSDLPRCLKALEAVLKLHVPIPDGPDWCRECGHSFPCWTRRAITAELTGKEAGDGA